MVVTANSRGEIVPGSKVMIKTEDVVYDVGEVKGNIVTLYKENKFIGKIPIEKLSVV